MKIRPANKDIPNFLEFDDGRKLDMRLRKRYWLNFITPDRYNDEYIFICNLCSWKGKWWRFHNLDMARAILPVHLWDYIIKGPQDMHTLPLEFLQELSRRTASATIEQAFWRLAVTADNPVQPHFDRYYETLNMARRGEINPIKRVKFKHVVYSIRYYGTDQEVRVANSKEKLVADTLRLVLTYCTLVRDYIFKEEELLEWAVEAVDEKWGRTYGGAIRLRQGLNRLVRYGFIREHRLMSDLPKRELVDLKFDIDTLQTKTKTAVEFTGQYHKRKKHENETISFADTIRNPNS